MYFVTWDDFFLLFRSHEKNYANDMINIAQVTNQTLLLCFHVYEAEYFQRPSAFLVGCCDCGSAA